MNKQGWEPKNKCYCTGENTDVILAQGSYASLSIECRNGKVLLVAWGEGKAAMTPAFCPICGRYLHQKVEFYDEEIEDYGHI